MGPKPPHDFRSTLIGWKHWIEDVVDDTIQDDERQPLKQTAAVNFESRQLKYVGKLEPLIRQKFKRQMQSGRRFALIIACLRRHAEKVAHTK